MKFLNLPSGISEEAAVIESTNDHVAAWFRLLCYCTRMVNGGVLKGAVDWSDAMWMRVGGLDGSSMKRGCRLWEVKGMNVIVRFYDLQAEKRYKDQVERGRKYGRGNLKKNRQSIGGSNGQSMRRS